MRSVYCKLVYTERPRDNLPMPLQQAMAGFAIVVSDFLHTFPDEVNTFRKGDIALPASLTAIHRLD